MYDYMLLFIVVHDVCWFCVWFLLCNAVIQYLLSFLVLQLSCWGRERAGCFTLIDLMVSCDFNDWSAVSDCGIYWSYLLINLYQALS